MSAPFGDRICMHEALFDDRWLKDTGITTLDFAKAMIDEGFHPMTIYFPLVVHGAMLIEPTESESLVSLTFFLATLRDLAFRALRGETEPSSARPITPRARGSTRRRPRASRCCAGRRPSPSRNERQARFSPAFAAAALDSARLLAPCSNLGKAAAPGANVTPS